MTKLPQSLEKEIDLDAERFVSTYITYGGMMHPQESEIAKECLRSFKSGGFRGALAVLEKAQRLAEALEKAHSMMPGETDDPTWPTRTIREALAEWKAFVDE